MSEEYLDLEITAKGLEQANFPEDRRFFDIISVPEYKEFADFKNKDKIVRKVSMLVQLSNGSKGRYVANKQSATFLANKLGTTFTNWLGIRCYYELTSTPVGKAIVIHKAEKFIE